MATADHTHDDMWRTPIPSRTTEEDEAETSARPSTVDERAVEDAWYQVLRRRRAEDAEDAEQD